MHKMHNPIDQNTWNASNGQINRPQTRTGPQRPKIWKRNGNEVGNETHIYYICMILYIFSYYKPYFVLAYIFLFIYKYI